MTRLSFIPFPRSFQIRVMIEPWLYVLAVGKSDGLVPGVVPEDKVAVVGYVAWPDPEDEWESLTWAINHEAELMDTVRKALLAPMNLN